MGLARAPGGMSTVIGVVSDGAAEGDVTAPTDERYVETPIKSNAMNGSTIPAGSGGP